ncbi:MAG: hydrogenase 3 maturation endopeptidase HyCI [Candidatus Hadarchaeota archaeon]
MIDLSALEGAERVVVVGVGNDMRGDDAAGLLVVRKLKEKISSPRLLILEAGMAPERFISEIESFAPSHVVFVDGADFGGRSGEVVVAGPEDVIGEKISTHALPISVLSGYLKMKTGAKVVLVGIQTAHIQIGGEISRKAAAAIRAVVEELLKRLKTLRIA